MALNPYAANKAVLHADRLVALKEGRQPYPVHVHFILSDLCNQDCHFCAYRIEGYTEHFAVIKADGTLDHNPNRMIPTAKALELVDDMATMGVKAVQFTGGGEPTVHPQCREIMSYARAKGMETALVTNGVLLKPELRDELMHSTWTRISLDCARAETYAAVRRVPASTFSRVLKNIGALIEERSAAESQLTVGVGFVVTHENWREVLEAAGIARDLGVDNLRISAAFQPENAVYFKDFHPRAAELVAQAAELSVNGFQVINNFGSRFADLEQQHPEYERCPYQHFVTYIGADQNVYRCCVTSYTDRGLIGSVKDRRLIDLWHSQEKQADFASFDARGCPRCQFNDKNREINHMIDHLPTLHGGFV